MLNYPPFAYRTAVDCCVANVDANLNHINRSDESLALIAGVALHAIEFCKRFQSRKLYCYPIGQMAQRQEWLMSGEVDRESIRLINATRMPQSIDGSSRPNQISISTAIIAGVSFRYQRQELTNALNTLNQPSRLWILHTGRLPSLVRSRSSNGKSRRSPYEYGHLKGILAANGYRPTQQIGFYGLSALLNGFVAGQCSRVGQPHLVDRFQHRMRDSLIETGRFSSLATYCITIAQQYQGERNPGERKQP